MKYIDADKLIAEIKRLKQENEISDDKEYAPYELDVACGYDMACEKILSLITSVQQKEQQLIGGQVFGATDVNQLYEGKIYIISNLIQDIEFGLSVGDSVKMLLIKD